MTELISILHLEDKEKLIQQLTEAGFAFAVWKMPQTNEVNLLIALKPIQAIADLQISDISPGFLINQYADNHPIKPFHIQGDIIIKNDALIIHPTVTASEIDAFKQRLINPAKSTSKQTTLAGEATNDFEKKVNAALQEIAIGTFEKVVLSRYRDEKLPEDFSLWNFYKGICKQYPDAFCSLTHIPQKGIWFGATPELLISTDSSRFQTVSLAGTKRLGSDQKLNEIAWTQKEIEEQALVSRYIINCFKKIRLREFHEHGPKTIQAGNLAHLKTEFIVNYDEVNFDELADQMLELLHPTSAVCGMPIDKTKPWIQQTENYDREFYSGYLGPVNIDGSSNLFVNLRCMKIEGDHVRFYAGAGITEDSDPQKEFEETEMKMDVLKHLI